MIKLDHGLEKSKLNKMQKINSKFIASVVLVFATSFILSLPRIQRTLLERRLVSEYLSAEKDSTLLYLLSISEGDKPSVVLDVMWNIATDESKHSDVMDRAVISLEWVTHEPTAFVNGEKFGEGDWDNALMNMLDDKEKKQTEGKLTEREDRLLKALKHGLLQRRKGALR